jgi:RNA polymerase sigma-70 factor, ECF subfamily
VDVAALFAEHHPVLFRYLARLTGDADVAADAAQEAFVRLIEKPPAPVQLRAWLFRVGTNAALEAGRTGHRRRQLLRDSAARVPIADPPPTPQDEAENAATRERVRTALAGLNVRDRTVLLLREAGFSHREIAEQVGTTTGSVGTIIARALERLAAELELDEEHAA